MEIYQLRYFMAVVETGSFTKAAENLFISQPSLSTGIKKLERELKVKLLERGGRRAAQTPEGRFFEDRARSILKEYDSALRGLTAFQNHPLLRLGTPRTIPISILSRVIAAFQAECPDVTLELCDGLPENLQHLLEDGELDLLLTAVSGSNPDRSSELLFHQQLMLAVPHSHEFTHLDSIRLVDLDDQPYIERLACEVWRANPELFAAAGIHPHVVYRADHEEWVINLISVGMGVSIMPVWNGLAGISYVEFSDQHLCRTVGLRSRSRQDSELVSRLRTFLTGHDWLSI